MYRVYLEPKTNNIILGNSNFPPYAADDLNAFEENGLISIWRSDHNNIKIMRDIPFTQFQREDGSAAGSSLQETIDYLNGVFAGRTFDDALTKFESISKNLKSYPATFNYSGANLSSIVYDIGGGQFITKTLNYTDGDLTSVVLSGNLPSTLTETTKTLNYTGTNLTSVSYS